MNPEMKIKKKEQNVEERFDLLRQGMKYNLHVYVRIGKLLTIKEAIYLKKKLG